MTTKLYSERKIRRRFFGLRSERPAAKPGQAMVLSGSGGTITLHPGRRATPGEAVWNGYDTVYEVDMGSKDFNFTCSAPAKGGDVSFQVAFSAGCRVSNPAEVVNRRIEDPTSMLQRVIKETISKVTAGFDIEEGQAALAVVREVLEKRDFSEKMPFTLDTINVSLELDDRAKEFLRKRRQQRRDVELVRESSKLTVATAQAEQLKQQHELEATKLGREFEMELERERAKMEADLAKERVQQEIEIQKMRLEVYEPMIEGGMWGLLVQQLAQNPNDIGRLTEVMLQSRDQKVQADLLMLKTLIEGDMIEDRHLKDVTARLIRNLEQSMGGGPLQILGDQPDRKRLPETSSASAAESDTAPPSESGDDDATENG